MGEISNWDAIAHVNLENSNSGHKFKLQVKFRVKNTLTSDTSRQCRWPFTNRWLKKSRIRKTSQRTKATWSALRLRLDTITCYTSLYTSFLSFWNWKDSHGLLLKFNWSTGNFWYLNSLRYSLPASYIIKLQQVQNAAPKAPLQYHAFWSHFSCYERLALATS